MRVGKRGDFLSGHLDFLAAEGHERRAIPAVADMHVKRLRSRHVVVVGQNQIQPVRVLHDGTDAVGKHRLHLVDHFRAGQNVVGRDRRRIRPRKPVADG